MSILGSRPARWLAAAMAWWLAGGALAADPQYLWVEAESAVEKLEHDNDWYDPVDRVTSLSGQDWWHSFDEIEEPPGWAVVPFAVPRAGKYRLWLRLNLQSTGYRWAIDGQAPADLPLKEWRQADRDNQHDLEHERRVFDVTFASHDGSNRHQLAWVKGPELDLAKGDHKLRFEVKPNEQGKGFAAVDCFVLAAEGFAFRPRMHYRPGETVQTAPELDPQNAWAFQRTQDTFAESPIDLRHLNEEVAGEHGFIRLSEDGSHLLRGDGQPIRFWSGSNYGWRIPFRNDPNLQVTEDEARQVARDARWQAKRGINMVRFHGHLPPRRGRNGPPTSRTDINEEDLHGAWYMVAAYKKEGIYSTISPYWGSHTDNDPGWDLGFQGGKLSSLVFFYPPVQQMYKGWLRRLYTEPNPYTGIPLKDDPALAIIQLQNEDSMLFFTDTQVKGEPLKYRCRQFGDFLKEKYGSLDKALARYRTEYESDWDLRGEDSVEDGTAALLQVWFLTRDARDRAERWDEQTRNRLDDQLEFYTETMRAFNAEIRRYLKEDLGCKQIINSGNWHTVDDVVVGDAERYSYTPNEVIGKNAYYGAFHNGINRGWQILTQHVYANWSALERPYFWPMNLKQVHGHPMMIFESLWVPPNLYQAEGPLLVAGQLSLTGVDSFYWFASGGRGWSYDSKWPYDTPMQMGLFPATALAFRRGYIAEAAEPVVYEERALQDIWQQQEPLIAESKVFDPNRDKGEMPITSSVQTRVDPLAFCVGPVAVKYGGSAANNRVSPRLAELIDKDRKILTSVTGQIRTDYGKGLYTVNAPKCQAVAGFLNKEREFALADVTIRSRNAYGSLVVVPLDDRPLAESRQVLVQSGTVVRPSNWIVRRRVFETGGESHEGFQILHKGALPELVENTDAEVAIANPHLRRAVALDPNGQPLEQAVQVTRRGNRLEVTLPPNALYTVLKGD